LEKLWTYNDYVDRLQHPNLLVREWAFDALDKQYYRTYTKEVSGLLKETEGFLASKAADYLARHKAEDAIPDLIRAFNEGRKKGKAAEVLGKLGYGQFTEEVIKAVPHSQNLMEFLGYLHFLGTVRNEDSHQILSSLFSESMHKEANSDIAGALLKHHRPNEVRRVLNRLLEAFNESQPDILPFKDLLESVEGDYFYEWFVSDREKFILTSPVDLVTSIASDSRCMEGVVEELEEVWPLLRAERDQDAVSLLLFKAQAMFRARYPEKSCKEHHQDLFEKDKMALAFLDFFATKEICWETASMAGDDGMEQVVSAALACYMSVRYRGFLMEALEPDAELSTLLAALQAAENHFPESILERIRKAAPVQGLIDGLSEDLGSWGDILTTKLMGQIGDKRFVPHLIRIIKTVDSLAWIYSNASNAMERMEEAAHEIILEHVKNGTAGDTFSMIGFLRYLPYAEAFDAAIQVWENARRGDRDHEFFALTLEGIGDRRGIDILKEFIKEGHMIGVEESLETLATLHGADISEEMVLIEEDQIAREERRKAIFGDIKSVPTIEATREAQARMKKEEEKHIRRESTETVKRGALKIGRNAKCPCGSGKKYKKCCMNK
jgi:hypothetical protein